MQSPLQACSRWTSLPDDQLTVDNVQELLTTIQDDLWVAAACVDRLVDDVDVQRTLLKLGLQRTEGAIARGMEAFGENGGDDSVEPEEGGQEYALVSHFRTAPTDTRLCHIRAILFGRLDRLNTFVEILKELPEGEEETEEVLDDWEDDPWQEVGGESVTPAKRSKPPIPLSTFLVDDLLQISCVLASQEQYAALRILFERHGTYLWSYRLVVLDSIPEHSHPSDCRDMLPSLDIATNAEHVVVPQPWRNELDWSEMNEVRTALEASKVTLGPDLPSQTTPGYITSHADPLTSLELSTWYKDRVDTIIAATGMVDMALTIIQHGASQGIPDLDVLGEELSLLARLVYDAPQPDSGEIHDDWTLARWNAMDPAAVVHAYLTHSTPETVSKDIQKLVMPYLFVLESRAERSGQPDPALPNRLLYDYILSAPLDIAAAVFEASKPTLPAAQRLIRNDEDIVRLALACLYGSQRLDEWTIMSRIFECLPAWNISHDDDCEADEADTTIVSLGAFVTPTTSRPQCRASDLLVFFKPLPVSSLSRALDILDVHLEGGEILARWSVPAPLRWFLQSGNDAAEQRAWANRMARRTGGPGDHLDTLEDWEWLLEDMLKLSGAGESGLKGAFGLLHREEIIRIFFGGLLSTGKFGIAKDLLGSSRSKLALDAAAVEDICLSASKEFYDNASSGNFKFGDMKLAYECLDVPPSSEQLIKEKEFIEATSRLSSFNVMSRPGIPISPIEIRLTKDRLSLVSRVLSSNADAYKHTQVVLDLVYKLGFRGDVAAEVKTLAMLANSALHAEDFDRAYETSETMVDTVLSLRSSAPLGLEDPKVREAGEVCWMACWQLGRQPEFDNVDKKLLLLGRALELCPPDRLHEVLKGWCRLETEDLESRKERLATTSRRGVIGIAKAPRNPVAVSASNTASSSLASRLQDFRMHMPTTPLVNAEDAAALAGRTFNRVTANFPFSIGHRDRSSDTSPTSGDTSTHRPQSGDVSAQANRVFAKGIGWLIGADDE